MGGPDGSRLRGLAFAKQFPNPAEPLRGVFVAEQLDATAREVDWQVIAPAPWAPRWLATRLGKPFVRGDGWHGRVRVRRPNYPVLPGRRLYTSVGPLMTLASRAAFSDAVREHRPQFVHAHALYPSGAAAARLARAAGLPLVVTVHGSDLYSNLVRESWRVALRRTAAAAERIVCVSPALARDVVAELGIDPNAVVVVPDTYDADRFTLADRDSVGGTRPVRLVSVGRLVDVKGHDVLIEALRMLVAGGLDLTAEIVGDGPLARSLADAADAAGLTGRVTFSGAVSGERLARALAAADLFVLPSRREGFGVALVEAMATGLPAVATRSGGPEAIVTSPDLGELAQPDDASSLAEAIAVAARRIDEYDHGAIAADVAARFSPAAVGARLVAEYRALVDAGAEGKGA